MVMKMSDKELVEEYITCNYIFTSNVDGWCIRDRNNIRYMVLYNMVRKLEAIFPDMNAKDICTEWYNKNVEMTEAKIYYCLSDYKLKLIDRPIIIWGGGPVQIWDVVDRYGYKFNPVILTTILPPHHNLGAIVNIFEKWYEEQKIIETEKMI